MQISAPRVGIILENEILAQCVGLEIWTHYIQNLGVV